MQLKSAPSENKTTPLRDKLSKAAVALLLMDAWAKVYADSAPATQMDITTLLYGEQSRAQVVEPLVRVTRLFPDGQSLSAQFGLDVITGASPSGALPSGNIQTTTTPSGHIQTVPAGEIPVTKFQDQRFGFDGDWKKPLSRYFTSDLGGHFSRERDYQSIGINEKISVDLMHRLLTLTAGAGVNEDRVFPHGGTPDGLSDGTIVSFDSNPKRVTNFVLGLSRILTRRWMVAIDGSRTFETGYLTEPYKIISLVDPFSGLPTGQLTDKRPSTHDRTSLLFSSVYHLTDDIIYLSYRYYWDTWSVRSNTMDIKYRHELEDHAYLEPHVRYYHQTAANFFTVALLNDAPLPDFATGDYRLGPLKTFTLGATYGFHISDHPGEWNVRAEYIRQLGDNHPAGAIGLERQYNLFPAVNVFAVVAGYSFNL